MKGGEVRLVEWNELLMKRYFPPRPNQRVYLRVDDAELQKLDFDFDLHLSGPAEDLLAAVQAEIQGDSSLGWIRHLSDGWRQRADLEEPPPWLAVLAVSVLVVARQTEAGSLAFYPPFSEALGLRSRFTQDEYEGTIFVWWIELANWLSEAHGGAHGLPSWRRIPTTGPRCVIGHPYTQILLKREDIRDMEAFLESLEQLNPGDLEVTDPEQAGADLLDRFQRWAVQHRVSNRLWDVLLGNRKDARDSVQYMLLDRLLDEIDERTPRSGEREVRLVLTLDDWSDQTLRFAALAPAAASEWESTVLDVDGQQIGPLQPGEPYPTPLAVDSPALDGGISYSVDESTSLIYRPSDVILLATRDWSIWCSVDDAEIGETVYVLVADNALPRLGQLLKGFRPSVISGVPEGWQLCGPGPVPAVDNGLALGLPIRRSWQAVPCLVGGLEVARHGFLVGGPPSIRLPSGGSDMVLQLDGRQIEPVSDENSMIDLTSYELGEGPHQVDVGPYRLSFELNSIRQLPSIQPTIGRNGLGMIVPVGSEISEPMFIGAIRRPEVHYDPLVICPIGSRNIVLAADGSAAECIPTMGSWALDLGLRQLIFEPAQSSSYPDGRWPVHPIRWIALELALDGPWCVVRVQGNGFDSSDPSVGTVSQLARTVVAILGSEPEILRDGDLDDSDSAAQAWRVYAHEIESAQ